MSNNTFKVPQAAWYDDMDLELNFPESWEVSFCSMKGAFWPPLSEEQIKEAFDSPIGTESIVQLTKGKKTGYHYL
jgi:hypothetical protein